MKRIIKQKVGCVYGVREPITYLESEKGFDDCMEHFCDENNGIVLFGLEIRCYTALSLYENEELIKRGYYADKRFKININS